MKWRPIKNAPRDEQILLAVPTGDGDDKWVTQGRWSQLPHSNDLMKSWQDGGTRNADEIPADGHWREAHIGHMQHAGACDGWTWEARTSILFKPTHWMPLPKPPGRQKRP